MIGYITLGTNNFESALTFYDALMLILGEKQLWKTDTMAAWGTSRNEPAFCITKPYNSNSASTGNGVMIAIKVESTAQVNSTHAKALELGATCEGKPGFRGENGFYAGYIRDLDGNKLNVYIPAKSA